MKHTTIISEENFITPVKVQGAIRNLFAFRKSLEVKVKYNSNEKSFELYEGEKYICSYDESGNEI